MKIKADDTTIGEQPLLGPSAKNIFRIPAYQRAYTWSQDQWRDIYSDLSDSTCAGDDSHFIGTFVFIESSSDGKTVYEVVDGQQRLTTISILFLALYQRGCELLYHYYKENDQNIKVNNCKYNESLNAIKGTLQFLYSKDQISLSTSLPNELKLRLSKCSNNNDNYQCLCNDIIAYTKELEECEPSGSTNSGKDPEWKKTGDGRSLIYRAHKYFYEQIKKEEKLGDDRISSVYKILDYIAALRDWDAVVIIAESTQDACLLFDSLNNRGIPLSPIDIVKNKLFEKLMQNKTNLDDYEEQWKKLVDCMKSEKILRRFFVDYYNISHNKYKTTKYTNERGTIEDYTNLINELDKAGKVDELFNDLQLKAKMYQIISNPESPNGSDSFILKTEEYKCLLIALVSISAVPAYGFLLYLYDRLDLKNPNVDNRNKTCFIETVAFLGKFFARRHVTDTPRVKYLAPIFNEMISKYDKMETVPVESQKIEDDFLTLLENDSRKNKYKLENLETLAYLLEHIEYEAQKTRSALIRYLFTQLEYTRGPEHIRKHAYSDLWRKEGQGRDKKDYLYTIEHIVPQAKNSRFKSDKDRMAWEDMLGKQDLEQRDEYVHLLGNLLLIKTNKEVGQKPFAEKKNIYAESEGKQYSYMQYVLSQDRWDRKIIEKHTSDLCTKIANSLKFNKE